MIIELDQVRAGSGGESAVVIKGRAGRTEGVTRTPCHRLFVGKFYGVEIDINEHLVVNQNVWTTSDRAYRLTSEDGVNTLVGQVDSLDDDGLVYFRLGVDSLLMLEIEPAPRSGEWLRITVPWTATRLHLT